MTMPGNRPARPRSMTELAIRSVNTQKEIVR
jgi:hypothetical protein